MSDSPTLPTGFGTVSREVLKRLHATGGYDITCVGLYHEGRNADQHDHPYEIIGCGTDPVGKHTLTRVLHNRDIDVMITLGDLWQFLWLVDLPARRNVPWLLYFPVDGEPIPRFCLPVLQAADCRVTYSEYGLRILHNSFPELDVRMIYHGVDTNVFRPLQNRQELRAELGLGDKFVVGFVGRNQRRKQIPRLLEAFSLFKRKVGPRKNVETEPFLYLHTCLRDIGWNVAELISRYGLADCSGFTDGTTPRTGLDRNEMARVYNLFDVMVLPSMGEGFGLPIVEALACGVPVIATDYSACRELVLGRGELIKPQTFLVDDYTNILRAVVDVQDTAAKMQQLYHDENLRCQYGKAGVEFARSLDWEHLSPQWECAIQDAIA